MNSITRFESLLDPHRSGLIEAAHGNDEVLWRNLCVNVYQLETQLDELRRYIRMNYRLDGAPVRTTH